MKKSKTKIIKRNLSGILIALLMITSVLTTAAQAASAETAKSPGIVAQDNFSLEQEENLNSGQLPMSENTIIPVEDFKNGGLEEGKEYWDDWGNAVIIEEDTAQGSKAIQLFDDGGMGQYIEIGQGETLVLSGYGKVDVVGELAHIGIDCINSEGSKTKFILTFDTNEWEHKSAEFITPAGTVKITLYVYKNPGEGTAYLDGISLGKIKGEGANEPEEPENPVETINLVVNGDFEGEYDNRGLGEPAVIEGWERDLDVDSGATNTGQTKIDASTGVYGTNSIRIGPGEGGRGQIINDISEGLEFTISGFGRVSEAGEIGYLGVDCLNNEGRKISGGKFGVEFNSTEYVEKSRTFKTAAGTASLQVYIYKNASSEGKEMYAYFDDIKLVQKPAEPEEVLLYNGSFEDDKAYWEDWGNAFIVEDMVAKGTKAIKLLDDGGMGQIVELIGPNEAFELSGYGKVDVDGEAAIIGVDCFDGVNPRPFKKFELGFTTTEYEQKSLKFTTPEGTVKIQIYVYKNPGEGAAYIDGIELKRTGEEIPGEEITGPGVIKALKPADYGVFFDDFTNGIDPSKWLIGKAQWGGANVNGGVIPENVSVSDGVVVITGRGDLYEGDIKGITKDSSGNLVQRENGKRTGGVIVTKYFYGSGSYEVRSKVLPQLGACSAFWTYFNDGNRNHEIDFEMPGEQNGQKAINKVMTNTWAVEAYNTSHVVDTPTLFGTENGITDGDWHTFRFDWHTDPANPRVEFFIDDVHVFTSTENIPYAAGRFWLGIWFPNNWAGVPNFDTDTMLIDWVRITPFNEEGDQWLNNYNNTWADLTEYPPMTGTTNAEPINKHNFTYLQIAEMNDKRALTDESIKDFVQQLEDFAIEYQFCDVGYFDANGKMPQDEKDIALTHQWIDGSRKYKPNQKIIATINGSLWDHVIKSEEMRQSIADECTRLINEFGFDGIQVDMEPFRKEHNNDLIDLLRKIRFAIGEDKHLSIATAASEQYLPREGIIEIVNVVDMINPMLYDSNGPGVGDVSTAEEYIEFWRDNVSRYSKAIAESNNKDCQLSPIMPAYDTKGYPSSPGWPDSDSGMVIYHLPEIENIKNAAAGLRQAIAQSANVYGSGIFWWGCFTSVQYDQRDGQDYAKDRKWWMEEWVNYNLGKDSSGGSGGSGGSSGGSGNSSSSGNSPAVTPETDTAEIAKIETAVSGNTVTASTTVTASVDSNGKAVVSVSDSQVSNAVSKAVEEAQEQGEGTEARLYVKVETSADAVTVETELSSEALGQALEAGIGALTISTPIVTITFDTNTLSAISEEAADNVKISVSKADAASLSPEAQKVVGDRPVFDFIISCDDKDISKFEGYVTISVPYTPEEGEDTNDIIICYINESGEIEVVSNGIYDPETGRISFSIRHFSKYAIGYNHVSFKDVYESAWYGKAVSFIAARKITVGTGDGNFSPEAKLTRGQFIVMLMKAYNIAPDADPKDNFADAGNTYYTNYLAAAKRLGISDGIGNNLFGPDREISYQEMCTILYNVLKSVGKLPQGSAGNPLSSYADAESIASWAKEAMSCLAEAGVIGGSGSRLSPASTVTRAEIAQILYDLISR